MRELKLKSAAGPAPVHLPKVFTMDEYLDFVLFNLKYTFDRNAWRNLKRESIFNIPFVLK